MKPRGQHIKKHFAAVVAAAALLIGCTAGDDTAADGTSGSSDTTGGSAAVPTGPAPGVTDEAVKVGVTYVDLASLGEVVTIDHGDYEVAYQAMFDDINASGGINGRMIEPVFAPVNPVGTEGAEAACVQLTQDEPVFVVMGFFIDDAVLCPLEAHQTAVIGSTMTAERLERAEAPWFTAEGSTDLQSDIVRAFAEADEFDGTLGVYAGPGEEAQLNDVVLPLLDDLGVDVAESAAAKRRPRTRATSPRRTQRRPSSPSGLSRRVWTRCCSSGRPAWVGPPERSRSTTGRNCS